MPGKRMTAKEARDHLARLDLSQNGMSRLFGVNPTTGRRWLSLKPEFAQDIPRAVEIALRLLTPAKLKQFLDEDAD